MAQACVENTLVADQEGARNQGGKCKEAVLAFQLDRNVDKKKILNSYLNVIYWGDGGRTHIVGAGTAAHGDLGNEGAARHPADTASQGALLPPTRKSARAGLSQSSEG